LSLILTFAVITMTTIKRYTSQLPAKFPRYISPVFMFSSFTCTYKILSKKV